MTADILTDDILARLRTQTRCAHDAIESVLDIMSPALSPTTYRQQLETFYGFYQPLEVRLAALTDWSAWDVDLAVRAKTPLLDTDLHLLQGPLPRSLPVCTDLPRLHTVADGFGCLYVLEGATLGGQIISRHVSRTLGLDHLHGAAFFQGYGEHTGAMWKAFRLALSNFASTPARQDAVIASALATFHTLQRWAVSREIDE